MWWLVTSPGKPSPKSNEPEVKKAPRVPTWNSTAVGANGLRPVQRSLDSPVNRPVGQKQRPRSAPGCSKDRSKLQSRTKPARPQSAPTFSSQLRAKPARPQSAPALLRDHSHKDEFLSRVENHAVHQNILQFRREQLVHKDNEKIAEALGDSSLAELLLMHNKSQRASRCSGPKRRPRSAGHVASGSPGRKQKASAAEQCLKSCSSTKTVRDLCFALDQSIGHHANNFGWAEGVKVGVSLVHAEVEHGLHEMSRTSSNNMIGLKEALEAVTPTEPRSPTAREEPRPPKEKLRSPSSPKRTVDLKFDLDNAPLIDPLRCPAATPAFLTKLAQLLVSACGTLEAALQSMDDKQRGRLTQKEWQRKLLDWGFPTENVLQSWPLLAKHEGEVFLDNMEALLEPYLNHES